MRPRPLPAPDEDPKPQPVPEPRGWLDPPRKKPPTALGLAKRRPFRSPSGPPIPARLSRVARTSRLMLGCFRLLGGSAVALTSPIGFAIGAAAIVSATRLIGRTIGPAA